MNVGSLFSGAGLMDWGLTLAGFDHAWFCESDPYCRRILELRWPGVTVYGNISALEHPDQVDVLAGGFPCQDVSKLGRLAGITGKRSGLWKEYARLVRELRPRYVLVENVPGLFARGMGDVLGDLADCGYDAEWDCLPASAAGAPHRRDRVFILAYPGREGRRENPGGASRDEAADGRWPATDDHVANGDGEGGVARDVAVAQPDRLERVFAGRAETRATLRGGSDWWSVEPGMGRMADGVPHRVDRLRAIGNGVVPQIAFWLGKKILEREAMRCA